MKCGCQNRFHFNSVIGEFWVRFWGEMARAAIPLQAGGLNGSEDVFGAIGVTAGKHTAANAKHGALSRPLRPLPRPFFVRR